ncbi:MAG: CDP-alcohol phosphatidyltransferase family protein [Pseudomonadota bacterium]
MTPAASPRRLFGWANLLTALRAGLILPIVGCIVQRQWLAAAFLFVVAVASDVADGRVARRLGEASALGGLFDHAVDALFVASSIAALAWLGIATPWLPVLVLVAFVQYMLDSRVLAGQTLRGNRLGRYNGVAYFVVVGIAVIGAALGLPAWLAVDLVTALSWILVASTLVSMAIRAAAYLRARRRGD